MGYSIEFSPLGSNKNSKKLVLKDVTFMDYSLKDTLKEILISKEVKDGTYLKVHKDDNCELEMDTNGELNCSQGFMLVSLFYVDGFQRLSVITKDKDVLSSLIELEDNTSESVIKALRDTIESLKGYDVLFLVDVLLLSVEVLRYGVDLESYLKQLKYMKNSNITISVLS